MELEGQDSQKPWNKVWSKQRYTKECIYNDLFKVFLGLNICGSGVETWQTCPGATTLIVDVASPKLTEIASRNIYIPKQFYENVWKVFDKSVSWERPIEILDVNNVFLLWSKLSPI